MASIPKPTASDIEYLNNMSSIELDQYVESLKTLEGQEWDLNEWYELVARRRESFTKEKEQKEKARKEIIANRVPMNYDKIKPFFSTPRAITKEYDNYDFWTSLIFVLVLKWIAILALVALPVLMYFEIIAWNYLLLASPVLLWIFAHIINKMYAKGIKSKRQQELSNMQLTYAALARSDADEDEGESVDEPRGAWAIFVYAKDPTVAQDALFIRRVADRIRELGDTDEEKVPSELLELYNRVDELNLAFNPDSWFAETQIPTTITEGKEVFYISKIFPDKKEFPVSFDPWLDSYPTFVNSWYILPKELWS